MDRMTYAQALMIVRNCASGYTAHRIKEAATLVLASLDASEEDVMDAGNAYGFADIMHREPSFSPGARRGDLNAHPFSGAISAEDY